MNNKNTNQLLIDPNHSLTFQPPQSLFFLSCFNTELTSILFQFLETHEILLLFQPLCHETKTMSSHLNNFQKLWMLKYIHEFKDAKEKVMELDYQAQYESIRNRYVTKSDMEQLKESEPWETYFQSMKKQMEIRRTLVKLIKLTRD